MSDSDPVDALIGRARRAQTEFATWTQERVDATVAAAGWAIVEPTRNYRLAEQAARDSGMGAVADKLSKNQRKTLGLLRDLQGVRTVGVIAEDRACGITEIARPVGVVAAVTPSTNPAATPANKLINALKGGNAIILAPSPKGASTCALLLDFVHDELVKVGAPLDLVQQLPPQGSRAMLAKLMGQADLVVATGSRENVKVAYQSGKPVLGVGVGNVAAIVLPTADPASTAARIAQSKTFDHATSCSSENSLVIVEAAWERLLAALRSEGGVLATPAEKASLGKALFPDGRLSPRLIARPATEIARLAGLDGAAYDNCRFILVSEQGVGPQFPFSGEKLSPVLTLYRVPDFDAAITLVRRLYDYQGKGHSVGVHGASAAQQLRLGLELPVCRVIVDQVHCFAAGGSFANGLPFSLSMGCGTWGGCDVYLRHDRSAQGRSPLPPQRPRRGPLRQRGASTEHERSGTGGSAALPHQRTDRTVLAPLYHGGSLVMPRRFSAADFWRLAAEHDCTWLNVVPTMIAYLLQHERVKTATRGAGRLRFCRSASAPLPPAQQQSFEERFGVGIIETMGLTETAAPVFANPVEPGARRLGSPGRAFGNEARVIDPDSGVEQAVGAVGEIVVRGENVMAAYYKAPEESARLHRRRLASHRRPRLPR